MIVYVVVHDHAGQIFTFSVNAMSQFHAIRKAERHCHRSDIWNKRIETFNKESSLFSRYKMYPFPNKKVK